MELLIAKEVSSNFYPPKGKDEIDFVEGVYLDEVFLLDDYNRFGDLSTTVKEYIPKVRVRYHNDETVIRMVNEPLNILFENNPLILLDAMPVFDIDLLAGFNPERIKSMGFIYKDYYLNQDAFQGVISLSSFNNDFAGFPIPENAIYFPYKGTQRAMDFEPLERVNKEKSDFYPDFRTTLLWETGIELKSNDLSFYTSEVTGTFEIKIKFFDEEGNECEIYETFEVQSQD